MCMILAIVDGLGQFVEFCRNFMGWLIRVPGVALQVAQVADKLGWWLCWKLQGEEPNGITNRRFGHMGRGKLQSFWR